MIQNISDRRRGLRAAAEVCTIRPPLPRRYGKVRASERTEGGRKRDSKWKFSIDSFVAAAALHWHKKCSL